MTGMKLLSADAKSGVMPRRLPLYQQVAEILVGRIARGEWKPKSLLPSEQKLAEELGVSPGTVRKALDVMAVDGLIERRQGVGTFVASAEDPSRILRFFRIANSERAYIFPDSREVSREVVVASPQERRVLNLARGQRTFRIRRIRSVAGRNMMTEAISLPASRFGSILREPGELPTTLYDFYEARFGVTIRLVSEQVRAVGANAEEAAELQVDVDVPLLEIDRHAFTFDAQPIEWRICRLDCRGFGYLNVIE